jgi:signal transduction histidine kinase
MTIKTRTALWIVAVVSLLMLVLCSFIYLEFKQAEQKLFQLRLKEKAINTVKLLDEVKEVDSALLKLIDKNTIDQIRDEKVWILDSLNRIVYSSIDDLDWQPSAGLLDSIRKQQFLVFNIDQHDAIGLVTTVQGKNRLVISAGKDQEGLEALQALLKILLIGILAIIVIVAFSAYLVAKQVLKPLTILNKQVEAVNDEQLQASIYIEETNTKDEIKELAISFNQMLLRLQEAFSQQKQFIQHASHELRTPLAALTNQIDLALQQDRSPQYYKDLLLSLQEDHDRLSKLLQQLLLLFRSGQAIQPSVLESIYLNELLDDCMDQIAQVHPAAKLVLNYANFPEQEEDLLFKGNPSLLTTAILGLLENACKYGVGNPVLIDIGFDSKSLSIRIQNQGLLIPEADRERLFTAFFRSSNTEGKRGFGLGLVLAFKIIQLHKGQLSYQVNNDVNCFICTLPK